MNLIASESVEINTSTSNVYDYVSNMENFIEWFPGVLRIESANGLMHGKVGKEYLEKVKVPLKGEQRIKLSVKEVEINRKFVTEGEFSPLLPRMEVVLTETESESCEVKWSMFSRNRSILFKIIFLPFVRFIINKRAKRGVLNLKNVLENKT